jgi:hypothetical protein
MNMRARGCALSRALATIALALTASLAPAPAARAAETVAMGDLVFVKRRSSGLDGCRPICAKSSGRRLHHQNGFEAGAAYKDASGIEVDTMILVYRLTLSEQLS